MTSYIVESDVDEVANGVVTTVVSRSTAEGEVPQQQAVIESRGGGEYGQLTVHSPAIEITLNTSVTGADTTFGFNGF